MTIAGDGMTKLERLNAELKHLINVWRKLRRVSQLDQIKPLHA